MRAGARGRRIAALLVLAASSASAGDAKTYRLLLRDRWKAGDAVTRRGRSTEHRIVRVTLSDGTVLVDTDLASTVEFVRVEKCLEADADGHRTKALVRFLEWSQVAADRKDESLKGATIELSGQGEQRAWKAASEGAAPSEKAAAWVEKELGAQSNEDRMGRVGEPKKEVAAGEAWPADLPAFAAEVAKSLAVDVEKSTATIRLESVDGSRAVIAMDYRLATKAFVVPQTGALVKWTDGGRFTVVERLTKPVDGSVGASETVADTTYKGEASDEAQGIKSARIDMTWHREESTKPGGEVPAGK